MPKPRIKLYADGEWGFVIGDEHSGFSVSGFATKAEAIAAAQHYA